LGRAHGKAEAWFIVEGGEGYLGLKQDVTVDDLKPMVLSQDVDALLSLLHRVEVKQGDIVCVPPGVLHAVGEGVLIVELQEPEACQSSWSGEASNWTANVTGISGSDSI
jgi:mannose-6-phosphate isomerase